MLYLVNSARCDHLWCNALALPRSQHNCVIASHYEKEDEDEGEGKETQNSYQVAEESEE